MPFEDLSPPLKASAWVPAIRMSASERKGGKVVIRISIPVTMLQVIGAPEDRYALQLGKGSDAGYVRLAKNKDGKFSPSVIGPNRQTAIFNLGVTDFAPDVAQKATECRFSPAGVAAIKIRLPNWCYVPELDDKVEA